MTKEHELRAHIDFLRVLISRNQHEVDESIKKLKPICTHPITSVEDVPIPGDTWSKGGKHVNTTCDHCGTLTNTFTIHYGDYD